MLHFRSKAIGWVLLFFISLSLLSGASTAVAKEYTLFSTGTDGLVHPVAGYDAIVSSLKKGDVVKFTDGKSYRLTEDLHDGQGSMSRVFSVKAPAGAALRLPRQSHPLFLEMINRSVDGSRALAEAGVSAVAIQEAKRGEYLLVDQVKPGFIKADSFFREPDQVSRSVRNKMVNRLLEFASATAYFKHIGDFGLSQLAYDAINDRWVLLDWSAGHETIELGPQHVDQGSAPYSSKNCFEHVFEPVLKNQPTSRKKWIESVHEKIDQAIRAERNKIQSEPRLLDQLKRVEEKLRRAPVAIQAGFMNCMISQMHHSFEF
jgi:hypothetical protein